MEVAVQRKVKYVVGAYEIDRAFGGPEEGGWWYNTGTLVRPLKVFNTEKAAYRYCSTFNHWLNFFQSRNREIREIYSMAYSGGRYSADVFENSLPSYFPQERPYYE